MSSGALANQLSSVLLSESARLAVGLGLKGVLPYTGWAGFTDSPRRKSGCRTQDWRSEGLNDRCGFPAPAKLRDSTAWIVYGCGVAVATAGNQSRNATTFKAGSSRNGCGLYGRARRVRPRRENTKDSLNRVKQRTAMRPGHASDASCVLRVNRRIFAGAVR
jgi:hypothetical protein